MEKSQSIGSGGSGLWEIVDATQDDDVGDSELMSMHSIEPVDSDPDNGKGRIIGQSQDFQMVHAKAVAQIEAEQKSRGDSPPLPVSKDLQGSDIHVLSSEGSLSGFSSGNSEFGSLEDKEASDSMPATGSTPEINTSQESLTETEKIVEPDSPEEVSALQQLSQEGPLEGSIVRKDPTEEKKVIFNDEEGSRLHDSVMQEESYYPDNGISKDNAANSPAWTNPWLQKCNALLRDTFPQGVWDTTCGHFQALLRDVDWKNLSKNTGIAVLSVFAFGLFVRNRKIAFELKRKHEEVARLMAALMNFQELWAANRSNTPVLRHASMVIHQ